MKLRNLLLGLIVMLHLGAFTSAMAQVATPVLGVAGVNNSAQTITVSISDATTGAAIRYTTDGTTPTSSSTQITSGSTLNISQTTTLKVVAFSGTAMSDLVTGQYTDAGLISSSANGDHTVVINKDGTISAVGNNTSGELGNGSSTASNLPVQTQITSGTPFTGAYPVRALTSTTLSQLPVISGLSAWYKADSITSGVGNPVTSWVDSSSNSNTVTQTNSANQPTLITDQTTGKPAVQFSGSQWLFTTNTIQGVNDVTIITAATGNGSGIVAMVGASYGSNASRGFGNINGQPAFTPGLSSGGQLNYVTSGTAPATGNLVASTLTYASASSTATFYSNGSANGTPQTESTVAVVPGLILGDSIDYGNFYNWNANVSEVLVYNRVLSTTERQQVESYLYNKYGIYSPNATWPLSYSAPVQAEIARDQLTQAQANAYVAFQAANPGMLTNGLKLWLAAGSITAANGANVSSWTDKAGGFTLSNTGSNQPTYVTSDINGQPAIRSTYQTTFGSSSSVPGISNDMTIIEVGMTTNDSATQEDAIAMGYSPGTRGLGYKGGKQYFDVGGYVTAGASVPPIDTFVIEMATLGLPVSGNAQVTYYRNGAQTSQGTQGGIGTPNGGISVSGWQGDLAEILVYDHQLSSTEIQQVTLYLANKYGLYYPNAAWISNFSPAVQTRINQNQWSEAQANAYVANLATLNANNPELLTQGLAVWLRADDSTKVATSGTNVTHWTDEVSGNVLTPTNTGSEPQFISSDLNNKPGIRFGGSSGLGAAASNLLGFTLNADMTIITVGMTTAPTTQQTSVDLGTARITGYKNSLEYFGNQSNYNDSGAAAPAASTFIIEAASINSDQNAISFYQNGVNTLSTPDYTYPSVGAGLWVGVNSDGSDFGWSGDINEILIYDHQLSLAEMQQVTAYLESKYNLDGSYAYPPPVVTPPGESSASSISVSISAAPAGTTIRYTLDGTTPTPTNGTVYSSSFTVSSSLPLSCAIFQGNTQASAINTVQFYVGDSDDIGISDAWQDANFGNLLANLHLSAGTVGINGLTYLQDYLYGYNPNAYSTNGDGLSDLLNYELGYAATDTDINGYLNYSGAPVTNAQQLALGLDPFGVGDNPPPSPPPTDPGDTTPPTVTLTIPQGATQIQ